MVASLIPAFSVVVPLRGLKLLFSNPSTEFTKFTYMQPQHSARTAFVHSPQITSAMPNPGKLKPPIAKRVRYYAIRRGRDGFSGITENWEQAKRLTSGVSNAAFKSFKTVRDAQEYLKVIDPKPAISKKPDTTSKNAYPHTRAFVSAINAISRNSQTPNPSNSSTVPSSPVHELYASTNATQLAEDAPDPSDDSPKELVVYTDGACSKNGKAGAKAGYAVYFGEENPYNVSEPLPETPTNQRAEMTAVLEAMRITLDHGLVAGTGNLVICTDSQVRLLCDLVLIALGIIPSLFVCRSNSLTQLFWKLNNSQTVHNKWSHFMD